MRVKSLKTLNVVILFILSFFVFNFANADDPGVIDTSATNQAKVCHNVACDDFGIINFELASEPSIIIDSNNGITGKVWGNELGWITMNPTGEGVIFANTETGELTGKAWSQVSGWINFAPTGEGVTINPDTGEFEGYAWTGGAYGGWIKFDCSDPSTCVKSTWVIGDDDGGGGSCTKNCGGPVDPVCPPGWFLLGGACVHTDPPYDYCPNIDLVQTSVPIGMYVNSDGQCAVISVDDGGGSGSDPTDDPDGPSDPEDPIEPEDSDPVDPEDPTDPYDPSGPNNPDENGGGDVGNIIEDIENEILDLVDDLDYLLEGVDVLVISNFVTLAGLISAGFTLLLGVLLSNPFGIADLGLNLMRLWSMFLYGVGFKKRNRPWGVVYDSVTKQPLDPVYVVLKNMEGVEIATSITDIDGRYGFLVDPGIYTIVAHKTNYSYPSLKLAGKNSDELYNDLYFGEQIEIKSEGEVIVKNIPLDRIGFDWNEFAKKEQRRMKFFHQFDVLVSKFSDVMFILGFLVSVIVLIVVPGPYNVIIFGVYVVMFGLRRLSVGRGKKGNISFAESGIPLSYGILRILTQNGQEIAHRVVDRLGNYYCLVPNGYYIVSIEKKNEDSTYSKVYTSEVIQVKKGIVKKDFKI
jgi:hypothetical protein